MSYQYRPALGVWMAPHFRVLTSVRPRSHCTSWIVYEQHHPGCLPACLAARLPELRNNAHWLYELATALGVHSPHGKDEHGMLGYTPPAALLTPMFNAVRNLEGRRQTLNPFNGERAIFG